MPKPNALSLLFPGRTRVQPRRLTRLQAVLQDHLTALAALPELQAAGLGQYLPLLRASVSGMCNSDIRAGREMMRGFVTALDAADDGSDE